MGYNLEARRVETHISGNVSGPASVSIICVQYCKEDNGKKDKEKLV